MGTERRRVVIGPRAARLRRELGPSGWVVLEELLACSAGPVGDCRADVSVRSLAAGLGLSKDTVARALSRLRRAGLVSPSQSRSASGGFACGSYTIAVPDSVDFDDEPIDRADTSTTQVDAHPPKRPRLNRLNGSQLALSLDD
ncbi:MAG TPA: helix-turn-helix domain-containing protein [Ilumatobacteraceae bacterium]